MNIFVLDYDPIKASQYHCDKHVVKMVLESAQLLCTSQRVLGNDNPRLYKSTHINHPCAIWTRESTSNYNWLFNLFCALTEEYYYRYRKVHKCTSLIKHLVEPPCCLLTEPTPFIQAMPSECKHKDTVTAYRNYYSEYKRYLATWTKREKPNWWR